MNNLLTTRALTRADLPVVETILDATGLFPSDMLTDMAQPFLSGGSNHHWSVMCDQETVVGFAYSEPERMTDNTHNLLAIAVLPDRQRQ